MLKRIASEARDRTKHLAFPHVHSHLWLMRTQKTAITEQNKLHGAQDIEILPPVRRNARNGAVRCLCCQQPVDIDQMDTMTCGICDDCIARP
ncbi:hypothetical protein CPY51_20870 [Rhizobium tubonense]|uniref:Uncharacterized protein n=1 Tax=Rhizobium tubonense TaxID=484088 RepID=A0A2W4CDE1_9HYPH|nr:hypothetical protein CPY51_20870 [Rhizobium tubonense]